LILTNMVKRNIIYLVYKPSILYKAGSMEIQTKVIRKENSKKVRLAFKHENCLSASQIRQETDLSIVTINSVVKDMIANNEIKRSNQGIKSVSGRPSTRYIYNRLFLCGCILYAYEKKDFFVVKAIVVDVFGTCICEKEKKTQDVSDSFLFEILKELKNDYPTIGIVTLGFPGVEHHGKIISTDFSHNIEFGFIEKLEEKFAVKLTFVNDINAAVYGNYKSQICEKGNIVGIYFPKHFTPGVGILIKGDIYSGTVNFAGEIGQIPYNIPWSDLYKSSKQEIVKQIEELTTMLICIIAPSKILLYSEYINKDLVKQLSFLMNEKFKNYYSPEIELCLTLDQDIKNGLIIITQQRIEKEYEERK